MSNPHRYIITLFSFLLFSSATFSQKDSTRKFVPVDSLIKAAPVLQDKARADSIRKAFSPKKATIRSAILPGWGQIYVKKDTKKSFFGKYWKVPVIYGALGIAGGIFAYNLKNYREIRFAYAAKSKASVQGANATDSVDYFNIKPYLLIYDANSLRTFRDEFRSNIDYSALFFILMWGLNVVDATVDAHLKTFDVSPDLGFRFKLGPSQMAGTTGLSFILVFK